MGGGEGKKEREEKRREERRGKKNEGRMMREEGEWVSGKRMEEKQ